MEGEKDKYDNYKDLVNDNYFVVPIAHEIMGSWSPDSLKFMEGLGIKSLLSNRGKTYQIFPVPKHNFLRRKQNLKKSST